MWAVGFPVLAPSNYPSDPEQYVKLAIFGESSVVGHNAERPFEAILRLELAKQFPDKRIYIRNYGRAAFPFHTYEAEILRTNLHRYDILLIYAGHNDVHPYLDETGYWRKPEFKHARMFVRQPGDELTTLTRLLDSHSRIFALLVHYQRKRSQELEASHGGAKRDLHFSEFETQGVLPPEEFKKIEIHFKEDMDEAVRLATRYNKQIIISSVPSFEEWKPFFSVRGKDSSGLANEVFLTNYRNGLEKFNEKKFSEALVLFQKAREIDEHVAIISYYIGMCETALDHKQTAREYLREAMVEDGFPARALYSLYDISRSIAQNSPEHVHFVDTIATFHNLIDRGYSYDDLFADFQHPSFMGQIVIGLNFLCEILKLEPFKSDGRGKCTDASTADIRGLTQGYWSELGLTPMDIAKTAFDSATWHYSLSSISAYPDVFLDRAERRMNRFYENSGKGPNEQQYFNYFLEMIKQPRASRQ